MPDFSAWLTARLEEVERSHLRRRLRVVDSPQMPVVRHAGRDLVNFSSNDYLGLAADDRLREAALCAVDDWGIGTGASRLISGTQRPHTMLEQAIAGFKQCDAALVFANGFAAAMGTIPALVGSGDVVILDKLSHACLVDGARMSGATIRVFPHNDVNRLESHLRWAREKFPSGNVVVITESVFSMDGDVAPLHEIVDLKERFGSWLFLDEAHAIGVIGEQGRGLAWECGVADKIEIQMGTLGKALGASGGYIAGSTSLIDWLINRARSFIFSTAPPAAVAAAATEALRIISNADGEALRHKLWGNIHRVSPAATSAIIPVPVGDEAAAVSRANELLAHGFWVPAVRYPTVPKNRARLRISVSAAHTPAQVDGLLCSLRNQQ